MKGREANGPPDPTTASGPADVRLRKSPPRRSAPGPTAEVLAPKRHMKSSLKPPQVEHAVDSGTHSATHSSRFPTMSKAPRAAWQSLRAPVRLTDRALLLQFVVPLSGPASGVPVTPSCHSALVGKRLPALAHASCAWNQVMFAAGTTAGRLTA